MSLTVLLIAVLHAVPVVLVGAVAKKAQSLHITAVGMGIVSLLYGSLSYALYDLLAVGVAWSVMLSWREDI